MKSLTTKALIAHLEVEHHRSPGGALAFDGDGTLWSGDIGDDHFDAMIERGELSAETHAALAAEAVALNLDASGDAVTLALRLRHAFGEGRIKERRMCEIMAWLAAGASPETARDFATRVLERVGLTRRLYGETMTVLAWAQAQGIAVYLVSASPRTVVEPAARLVGIDAANVVATTEERDSRGRLLPSVVLPIPYDEGKVTNLRAKLGVRPLYAAFGDNAFDVPMLREAHWPLAVRPKSRLLARAHEIDALCILEP